MLKIERKLIEFVERHILIFQMLLVSALAFYIRRIPIWWNTENVAAYFDFHENCTQSGLYYLLVRAVQYLPMLPVHSIKWISVIGDFGTAVLCLLLIREKNREDRLLQVFCYTLCLFSPVMFLRGAAWAQIDSLAVMFFLLGWLLCEKKSQVLPEICMLLSALLYPCMLVFVFWFFWSKREERGSRISGLACAGILVLWLILNGLTGSVFGKGFWGGLTNGFAWTTYDPVTGQGFATGLDWILEMLVTLGLPFGVIGSLELVQKKRRISVFVVLAVHFLITVLYGSKMF